MSARRYPPPPRSPADCRRDAGTPWSARPCPFIGCSQNLADGACKLDIKEDARAGRQPTFRNLARWFDYDSTEGVRDAYLRGLEEIREKLEAILGEPVSRELVIGTLLVLAAKTGRER